MCHYIPWYNVSLQYCDTMCHYNTMIQCVITIPWYNASLQYCDTMHHYNTVIQCVITILWYNASLQYRDTMRHYNTVILIYCVYILCGLCLWYWMERRETDWHMSFSVRIQLLCQLHQWACSLFSMCTPTPICLLFVFVNMYSGSALCSFLEYIVSFTKLIFVKGTLSLNLFFFITFFYPLVC